MDSKSVKGLPERRSNRKRKVDHVEESPPETSTNVSPAAAAKNGDGTSIWDDNFPFGDFVDKQFIAEKDCEAFDVLGLEKCSQVMLADSVRSVFLVRSMGRMVGDLEEKNKACIEENTELKKKLSEYEKDVGRLKENLEELSSEKSRLMEKEENLIEENSKIKMKLLVKEDIIDKMKAEIEEVKAEIGEVKAEIAWQYDAGFNEAVKKVLVSIPELKPNV